MLGKTAGGLYWMFRFLERAENTARLVEAGFRIALTRSTDAEGEWKSVVTTAAVKAQYDMKYDAYTSENVVYFLLQDMDNPSSVLSVIKAARDNARLVRTALTTEVWSAVNEAWMQLAELLKEPVTEVDLPAALATIRRHSAVVRGALHGTMLRNDIYDFCRIGTFIERVDNTARILDVKYYTLLPSPSFVGSNLDNVQWEMLLRSVSAHRSYRHLNDEDFKASGIADFLILDRRMPRSLAFSVSQLRRNLDYLAEEYDDTRPCLDLVRTLHKSLKRQSIDDIFEEGLHEFLEGVLRTNNRLGSQIEEDYRFNA